MKKFKKSPYNSNIPEAKTNVHINIQKSKILKFKVEIMPQNIIRIKL